MSALYFEMYFEPANDASKRNIIEYIKSVQTGDYKNIVKLDRENVLSDPEYYLDKSLNSKQVEGVCQLEFDAFTSFDWEAFIYFLNQLGDSYFELRMHDSQTGDTFLYVNLRNVASFHEYEWRWMPAGEEYHYQVGRDIVKNEVVKSESEKMSLGFALFKYGVLTPIIVIGMLLYYPFAVCKHKTLFVNGRSKVSVKIIKARQYLLYINMPDHILEKSVGLEVPIRIPELNMLEYHKSKGESPFIKYLDFMNSVKTHNVEVYDWMKKNYKLPVKASKMNLKFDLKACDIIDMR